jgi:catechol 2,3-dioxygenase-like lactoylglutathione lyase family enzyme
MAESASYQITIDCADPDRMARFWALVLGYELQGPPDGFETWQEYWLSVGVPEDEVEDGFDSVVDPAGVKPRIWFQQVPEAKSTKNRLHFDLLVGGGRSVPIETRRERVVAEAEWLAEAGATERHRNDQPEYDHFFIGMGDPEGNEFDVV